MKKTDNISKLFFEEIKSTSDKFSHVGYSNSIGFDFESYLIGYAKACELISNQYKIVSSKSYKELDTLFYPLMFLYRHTVELWIKFLFVEYSFEDKDVLKTFWEKNGHKLIKSWDSTKQYLEKPLLDHSSSVDLKYIRDCINEIDEFDKLSMRNRFPIDKNNKLLYDEEKRYDILKIISNYNKLFAMFMQIHSDLCGMDNPKPIEKSTIDKIVLECERAKIYIPKLKKALGKIKAIEKEISIETFIQSTPDNALIALFLMIRASMCPKNLPKSNPGRKEEFVKIMDYFLRIFNFSFDSTSKHIKDKVSNNLFCIKIPSEMLESLEQAEEIMGL